MAFISNNHPIVDLSYINTLYNELNEARQKFNFSTVSSNKNQYDLHTASDISTLNSYINEMSSNKYLKDIAISNEVPIKNQTYIIPYYFNSIYDIIQTIKNTCNHNPCDCHCDMTQCNCDCNCRNCYNGASTCSLR